MTGPHFFQTRMGQRFYEVTLPRIADELAKLNTTLAALTAVLRERLLPAASASESAREHK